MDVYGVSPATSTVLKNPVLNSTTRRLCEDTLLGTVCPINTIDLPFATSALELELVFNTSVSRWEWHIAKLGWQSLHLARVFYCIANNKLHNLVGVEVISIVGDLLVASQRHVAVLVVGEVHNNLISFSHGDIELCRVDRVQQETSIGANDLEIKSGANLACLFEVQLEGSADRGVQKSEPVLAWLDLEVWPRLSVHVDHITEQVSDLVVRFRRPETAVRVVSMVARVSKSGWKLGKSEFYLFEVKPSGIS